MSSLEPAVIERKNRPGSPLPASQKLECQTLELAQEAVAAFRKHGHLCNILTHISGQNWARVEAALGELFTQNAEKSRLSPLAVNILELLCADRGVSGRIARPYFAEFLSQTLPAADAHQVTAHLFYLFSEKK